MYPDLNGKTAVVTGASVGLGHGIARRFLQEGMSVVVNFHSDKHRGEAQKLADEFNAPGETARVVLVQADISQEDGAPKLRDAALEHFGGIDVWVNNAGIESRHPTHELPLDVWEKTLAVNLTGVFLGSKAALGHFVEQDRKGCIVNLSSVHERIPWPTFAHYAASKGGVKLFRRDHCARVRPPRHPGELHRAGRHRDAHQRREVRGPRGARSNGAHDPPAPDRHGGAGGRRRSLARVGRVQLRHRHEPVR